MPITRKLIVTGTGVAGAMLAVSQLRKLKSQSAGFTDQLKSTADKKLLTIQGLEALNFPWEQNVEDLSRPENWEFRKVTMRGVLGSNIHLVYREREGKPGCLVFKPLTTATVRAQPNVKNDVPESLDPKAGIMVNLGWLPMDKIRSVGDLKINYVKAYEPGASSGDDEEAEELPSLFPQLRDPFTSVVYNAEGADDLESPVEGWNFEEVVITGFLRKGEQPDALLGRKYWRKDDFNTVIDLEKMSAFYSFLNYDATTKYYLEAAVEKNLAKAKKNNDLAPTSFENTESVLKEYEQNNIANKYKKIRNISGVLALIGLVL